MFRSTLWEPGLNCPNCAVQSAKSGKPARCETPIGCPIEDIQNDADSFELHKKVGAFFQAETLGMNPAYQRVQARVIEESGLAEESPELLIAMRNIFEKYKEFKRRTSS